MLVRHLLRAAFVATLVQLLGCSTVGSSFGRAGDDDDDAPIADDDDAAPSQLVFGLPAEGLLGDVILSTARVPEYGGDVSFFHVGGELPPGVRITANGVFEGVLEAPGTYTFSILATAMTVPDITDEGQITVGLPDVPLHLGVVHDRPTTLTAEDDLMRSPWVRLQAVGDESFTAITLDVARFHPGLNGEQDEGWGDDIRVETVPISSCDVVLGAWVLPDDTDCDPNDRPPHCNEDDPMTYLGAGRFRTGADTGHYDVTVTCGGFGSVDIRVMAVPPGWCPLGEHYGGPSWQHPGACEPG